MRNKRHALSVSPVLEEILQTVGRQSAMAARDRAVTAYYAALSDAEVDAQADWGRFAMKEFTADRA